MQIQDPASGLPRMNRFPRTAMNMAASVFALGGMYQEQSTRGMPTYIQAPLQGSEKEEYDCWDNRRAPKKLSVAGDSENSLRESMGMVFTSRHASFPRNRGSKIALGSSWSLGRSDVYQVGGLGCGQAANLLRWESRLVAGDVNLSLATARVGKCGQRRFAPL